MHGGIGGWYIGTHQTIYYVGYTLEVFMENGTYYHESESETNSVTMKEVATDWRISI